MEIKNSNPIFKDYTIKIQNKLLFGANNTEKVTISNDINNLIILLNWCFLKKNNFFVVDFNKKNIFSVCKSYNQLKTNILSKELFFVTESIFDKIETMNLKTIKFILYNYLNTYDVLSNESSNTELCEKVTKDSIKNCIQYINICLER